MIHFNSPLLIRGVKVGPEIVKADCIKQSDKRKTNVQNGIAEIWPWPGPVR